jgi:gliding motility-associated-like protein
MNNIVIVPGPMGTFTFTPTSGCRPLEVAFTSFSNNSTSYVWDFGDGALVSTTNTTITHIYTNDIVATPILLMSNTLSDGTLCQLPAPFAGQVTVSTLLNVNIASSVVTLTQDQTFTVLSTVGNLTGVPIYSWSPTDGLSCSTCQTPIITGNGSGQTITYTLTVTEPSVGACIGDDSIKVIFPRCLGDISIPNVFTPNGDEINDYFDIKGVCENNTYLLQIYDRWGIKMFTSEYRNLSWDGRTTSGMKATEGVYYYVLKMDDKYYSGFVQLIR